MTDKVIKIRPIQLHATVNPWLKATGAAPLAPDQCIQGFTTSIRCSTGEKVWYYLQNYEGTGRWFNRGPFNSSASAEKAKKSAIEIDKWLYGGIRGAKGERLHVKSGYGSVICRACPSTQSSKSKKVDPLAVFNLYKPPKSPDGKNPYRGIGDNVRGYSKNLREAAERIAQVKEDANRLVDTFARTLKQATHDTTSPPDRAPTGQQRDLLTPNGDIDFGRMVRESQRRDRMASEKYAAESSKQYVTQTPRPPRSATRKAPRANTWNEYARKSRDAVATHHKMPQHSSLRNVRTNRALFALDTSNNVRAMRYDFGPNSDIYQFHSNGRLASHSNTWKGKTHLTHEIQTYTSDGTLAFKLHSHQRVDPKTRMDSYQTLTVTADNETQSLFVGTGMDNSIRRVTTNTSYDSRGMPAQITLMRETKDGLEKTVTTFITDTHLRIETEYDFTLISTQVLRADHVDQKKWKSTETLHSEIPPTTRTTIVDHPSKWGDRIQPGKTLQSRYPNAPHVTDILKQHHLTPPVPVASIKRPTITPQAAPTPSPPARASGPAPHVQRTQQLRSKFHRMPTPDPQAARLVQVGSDRLIVTRDGKITHIEQSRDDKQIISVFHPSGNLHYTSSWNHKMGRYSLWKYSPTNFLTEHLISEAGGQVLSTINQQRSEVTILYSYPDGQGGERSETYRYKVTYNGGTATVTGISAHDPNAYLSKAKLCIKHVRGTPVPEYYYKRITKQPTNILFD